MKTSRCFASTLAVASGLLLVSTTFAGVPYAETWDDPVLGGHNWKFHMTTGGGDPSRNVNWYQDGTDGVIWAQMDSLTVVQNCYAPFFTHVSSRERSQDISLWPQTSISVELGLGTSQDDWLGSGNSVYFVIGVYEDEDGEGPGVPDQTFYRREYPMKWSSDGLWHPYSFQVGYESDWEMFCQKGKLTPLSALWANPQQYAFAIMNDDLALPPGSPMGTLWATSFEVIPEPAAAGLALALSALGFAGVRRVNNKR